MLVNLNNSVALVSGTKQLPHTSAGGNWPCALPNLSTWYMKSAWKINKVTYCGDIRTLFKLCILGDSLRDEHVQYAFSSSCFWAELWCPSWGQAAFYPTDKAGLPFWEFSCSGYLTSASREEVYKPLPDGFCVVFLFGERWRSMLLFRKMQRRRSKPYSVKLSLSLPASYQSWLQRLFESSSSHASL